MDLCSLVHPHVWTCLLINSVFFWTFSPLLLYFFCVLPFFNLGAQVFLWKKVIIEFCSSICNQSNIYSNVAETLLATGRSDSRSCYSGISNYITAPLQKASVVILSCSFISRGPNKMHSQWVFLQLILTGIVRVTWLQAPQIPLREIAFPF